MNRGSAAQVVSEVQERTIFSVDWGANGAIASGVLPRQSRVLHWCMHAN